VLPLRQFNVFNTYLHLSVEPMSRGHGIVQRKILQSLRRKRGNWSSNALAASVFGGKVTRAKKISILRALGKLEREGAVRRNRPLVAGGASRWTAETPRLPKKKKRLQQLLPPPTMKYDPTGKPTHRDEAVEQGELNLLAGVINSKRGGILKG
jgi:hypothetical protein